MAQHCTGIDVFAELECSYAAEYLLQIRHKDFAWLLSTNMASFASREADTNPPYMYDQPFFVVQSIRTIHGRGSIRSVH